MQSILLIEDNNEIRENTAEILELAGYKVYTASNGKIGIEKALEVLPNLIVCDIMMPVLDGYGVLHLVNSNPILTGIPFIFLTAKAERNDFRKGMELGADDYITKPFDDIELLSAIERRFKKIALLQKDYKANAVGLQLLIDDFSGKNPLEYLAKSGNINHYKKKQIIYAEGNHPVQLFYIEKGRVKTFRTNNDGKELTMGLFSEGDFFGYNAIFENTMYHEFAESLDDSEICLIEREAFEKLLYNNKELTQKFIKLLANNVEERETQLLSLAYNSLRKKVANAILSLQNKFKKEESDTFTIHISREDLSNIAGTATESLIRTLSDFKTEKLIDIKDGCICILNEKKLQSLFN
ncbi:MAG: response regulator [Ferruginibacter sp.]|nr:response regulator [Ferruginibacter sp.]